MNISNASDETFDKISKAIQKILDENGVVGKFSGICLSDGSDDALSKINQSFSIEESQENSITPKYCYKICTKGDQYGNCIAWRTICR